LPAGHGHDLRMPRPIPRVPPGDLRERPEVPLEVSAIPRPPVRGAVPHRHHRRGVGEGDPAIGPSRYPARSRPQVAPRADSAGRRPLPDRGGISPPSIGGGVHGDAGVASRRAGPVDRFFDRRQLLGRRWNRHPGTVSGLRPALRADGRRLRSVQGSASPRLLVLLGTVRHLRLPRTPNRAAYFSFSLMNARALAWASATSFLSPPDRPWPAPGTVASPWTTWCFSSSFAMLALRS